MNAIEIGASRRARRCPLGAVGIQPQRPGRRRATRRPSVRCGNGDRRAGIKHTLAVVEGDTENATVAKDLLVDLRDRGFDTTWPMLVVIDGSKALYSAVETVVDRSVVARCQLQRLGGVESKLRKA